MTLPALLGSAIPVPALVAASDAHARLRFLESFASAIRNPHTRRAYLPAVNDFLRWCETLPGCPRSSRCSRCRWRAGGDRDRAGPQGTAVPDHQPLQLSRTPCPRANAYLMVRRRTLAAGISTRIGNHSFRATGITAYLKNVSTLENAAAMANHASTRTTQLYDRRRDEISLGEVERIRV